MRERTPDDVDPRGRLFDAAAEAYRRARPGYPDEVFALLRTACGLGSGSKVLEIGAGAGQATVALLEHGAVVTAVEPGVNLANELRKRAAGQALKVIVARFEDAPVPEAQFDFVVAASAVHWIDPAVGVRKAALALRNGGWFAMWTTTFGDPDRADPFHDALQRILASQAPELLKPTHASAARLEWLSLIGESGAFEPVQEHIVRWEGRHDGAELRLLFSTFSPWLAIPDREREDLLESLECLARERFGNSVVRPYRTVVHLARRRSR
jgi:SAM-dependent methyltransferase